MSFQQVKPLPGTREKTAANTWACFVDTWCRIFGFPDIIVVDPGGEFEGEVQEPAEGVGGRWGVGIIPNMATQR